MHLAAELVERRRQELHVALHPLLGRLDLRRQRHRASVAGASADHDRERGDGGEGRREREQRGHVHRAILRSRGR